MRTSLQAWASARGLSNEVDAAGNLLIRKPASVGNEERPGVVLQAHLDMVCQANAGTEHDFYRDPIQAVLRPDGWMQAEQTTLGADNGIGVALILAVLEDETLHHGPIEALLTVDEEAGMGGARGLAEGWLSGRRMLNLDTEAWGEFFLGCAGGLDIDVVRPGRPESLPADHVMRRVTLRGLRGGHSGVDIHEGRGNAIKLLVAALCELQSRLSFRLIDLKGGSARNAIPREASALLAVPSLQLANLRSALDEIQQDFQAVFNGIESKLIIDLLNPDQAALSPVPAVMSLQTQHEWLHSLNAAHYGVWRMSHAVPGIVETSNNIGVVHLTPEQGSANFMVRSLATQGAQALAREIASVFALTGGEVVMSGHYPGWLPNPDSPLLKLCQQVFEREFGEPSLVKVIHAGLECGLIADKYPGMDMVSFGPTIRGAHAPGEAVEIASVGKVWQLLCAILAEMQ